MTTASRPVRRDQYIQALLSADRSPEVIRATGVATALALTARSDGTRASLSGGALSHLFGFGATDSTARRHIRALREAGWLVQTSQGGRRGNKVLASLYSLAQPVPATLEGVGQPSIQMDARTPGPNRSRLTLQPSTQMDASSPQERTQAHPGARSAAAARDPVRQVELEGWWPQAETGGPSLVLDWLQHYRVAAGHEQAVAWLCAAAFYDVDEHGVPDSGDVDVDRVVWLACVLAEVAPDRVDCWTQAEIEQAAAAATALGLDEAEAFAALTYLAADDASAGTPPRTPAELPRLLKKTRTDPYARIALREARQWLAEWQQVTAARRAPTTEETA